MAGIQRVDSGARSKNPKQGISGDPRTYWYSSDESNEVCKVCVPDRESRPCRVTFLVQDIPAKGLINTGADIAIMGRDPFKKVAPVAQLHKRDFKQPDKVPVRYTNEMFQLDGRMDLDITFRNTTIRIRMPRSSSCSQVSAASLGW